MSPLSLEPFGCACRGRGLHGGEGRVDHMREEEPLLLHDPAGNTDTACHVGPGEEHAREGARSETFTCSHTT